MRKIKLMAIALIMVTTGLFANNIDEINTSKDEIRNQIIQLIETSGETLNSEALVKLTFTFSTEGEIVVLKVNSTNAEVLSFVRENINGKMLNKPGKVNKKYTMPINVKKG